MSESEGSAFLPKIEERPSTKRGSDMTVYIVVAAVAAVFGCPLLYVYYLVVAIFSGFVQGLFKPIV